jgi:NAD(P)-dependent dehydrogenase (short-subunit alcohol dehydrogenase family)
LATLTREIESRGGRASFVVTDVAFAKDVERMVAQAIGTFGRLDFAVNNAGIEGKLAGITDLPAQAKAPI